MYEVLGISPYIHVEVAPQSDTENVPLFKRAFHTKAFSISGGGTLHVTHASGEEFTYEDGDLIVGAPIPGRIQRVWSTGTTVPRVLLYY